MSEHVCGYNNQESAKYCGGCGVALVITIVTPGACAVCGLPIMHHLKVGTKEVDGEGLRVNNCSVRLPA